MSPVCVKCSSLVMLVDWLPWSSYWLPWSSYSIFSFHQVGWYNAVVTPPFRLPYHEDTLAVLLISTPTMFEKLFVPFLSQKKHTLLLDPLDQCMKELCTQLCALYPGEDIEALHDFDQDPATRRPKILVQSAGHVSGATFYYQRSDVQPDHWPCDKNIYGVAMHPLYGGWFAFRGALIFRNMLCEGLAQSGPVDCVRTREKRIELLEAFNFRWQDSSYRDTFDGQVLERYSADQKEYFLTEPSKRAKLLEKYLSCNQS